MYGFLNRRKLLKSFFSILVLLKIDNSYAVKRLFSKTGFITDPVFFKPIFKKNHPENPKRLKNAIENIKTNSLLKKNILYFPIRDVAHEELSLIHTHEHITGIKKNHGGRVDSIARAGVGGVLNACDNIIKGNITRAFVASRPPGHHAINYGREEGFCFYNNISIATRYLQQKGYKKILIIDWDYHHGNGTEYFFYDDPSVLYFSTHDMNAYPWTGDPNRKGKENGYGFNVNVHLPCGSNNSDIERAYTDYLIPKALKFKPDFVLISAGFDSRDNDLLGCFKINDGGYRNISRIASAIANTTAKGRIVSVLEGGYNPTGVASSMIAHIEELLLNRI